MAVGRLLMKGKKSAVLVIRKEVFSLRCFAKRANNSTNSLYNVVDLRAMEWRLARRGRRPKTLGTVRRTLNRKFLSGDDTVRKQFGMYSASVSVWRVQQVLTSCEYLKHKRTKVASSSPHNTIRRAFCGIATRDE